MCLLMRSRVHEVEETTSRVKYIQKTQADRALKRLPSLGVNVIETVRRTSDAFVHVQYVGGIPTPIVFLCLSYRAVQ